MVDLVPISCRLDRLTAQVEYVQMMECKAVQMVYPADQTEMPLATNRASYAEFASLLFHICDHLPKEQFDPSHLIGVEGT
jgi:hypothetical protein